MPILVLGDKRLEYDINAWTNKDAIALQQATGLKWGEWVDSLSDVESLTGLVWMVRRKNGEPDLRFNDVEFGMGDLSVEPTDAEKAQQEKDAKAAEEAAKSPTQAGGRQPSARKPRARTSGTTVSSS